MVEGLRECPSCGQNNRPERKFCASCGQPLTLICASCEAVNQPGERYCGECGAALADAPARPLPSTHLAGPGDSRAAAGPDSLAGGRYELKRFLGEGGRKRVYLAHDRSLDRNVAIALIKTEGLDDTAVTRARREAEAMGRLGDQPHIVTIHDIGEDEGRLYVVSQYMAGGDLGDLLEAQQGHRLSVERAVDIATQVCRALEHAHGHGVVHRDIKPKNVWLTEDGVAKLGDFGLAVALDRSRITLEGMMVGTVAYMPPEQSLGQPVDARSDLYSLGALLYELVCGRPPFVGDDAVAIISQHINTAPVAPSWVNEQVPRALDELILKLLAKAPDERPQGASAVRQTLETLSSGEFVAPEPIVPERASPLDRMASGVFVGREHETEALRSSLEAILSGRGRVVMLSGEMGIGKTRLASELGTYASLRGAKVLWGRCYEGEGAPSYWPWVQIVRAYVHDRDPQALSSEMGSGAADIAQIVSEVRERLPGLPQTGPADAEQARFRLFDAVTSFLRNAAAAAPMVLILDDLQWADRASLLLLQFLGGQLRGCRILVVGTYRDSDVNSGHPLAEVLATLRRDSDHKRLPLRGLSMQEARALLEASAEHELGTREVRIAELMYERTEGNPFFIEEVIRHLVEAGQLSRRGGRWVIDVDTVEEVGIPEGVRETVGRRLARLSPECRELLSTAAVIGRQFELEQLQQITGSPPPTLLETLDEAVQARIIVELPDGLGRYAFVHGLTRETLYEQLPRARRVNTHLSVMSALESLHADSIEAHLPELAHHANQAILVGGPGKAVEYATRAAARAASMLAYEDAVTHYDAAVSALGPQGSAERRLELLMALGSACWSSGEYNRSRDAYRAAAELAKELGSSDQLALAALGYSGELYFETGQVNATKIALLESALEALGDEDSPLRVRVMSRLAEALTYAGDPERRDRLGQEAVAMARRIDDPSALAQALTVAYVASWSMDTLEERLRAATEAISLAEQAGDRAMAAQARALLTGSLLEHGDIDGAEREIRLLGRSADELGFSYYRWAMITAEAALLLLRGKFADVEEVAAKALAIGQATQNETAFQAYATQVSLQRLEQRQLGGLVDGATAIVEQYPALPVWRCGRALCCVEDGRAAEARAELDELAVDDFSLVRSNPYACLSLCFLAEVAARLSDADRAQTLYDLLAPYGDRLCVAQPFLSCHGSISRHLGLLATTLARYEQAAEHFEDAIATNARIDAPGWLAHCQVEYADTLLRHGETSERHKALELLSQALDIASELNMPGVIEQALALKMRSQGIESLPAGSSIDAVADSVELERPHLGQHAAPDGTVTLLFTDIENSTETTERLGDKRWLELLSDHNAIIHEETSAHGGFEVKSQGDGFMLAFPSASRALLCAVGIQRAIEAYTDSHPDSQLRVRIGLHTGEVIRTGDDFFGRHVILAARIAAAARGDEILVSELLKQLVEPSGEWQFADAQEVELKGLSGTHRLFSVEWQSEPAPVSG